jgi:hypothetical protein
VSGHWQGDLVAGKDGETAVDTLVDPAQVNLERPEELLGEVEPDRGRHFAKSLGALRLSTMLDRHTDPHIARPRHLVEIEPRFATGPIPGDRNRSS